MPVQRTKNGQYFSTLQQCSYESFEEASEMDRRAALQHQAHADERNDLLGKLTPEETKLLVEQMIVAASDQAGAEQAVNQVAEWMEMHPEFIADGVNGDRNGTALRAYLLQQGRRPPYSIAELDEAYEAMNSAGALVIDPKKIQKSTRTQPSKRSGVDPYDILSAGAAVSYVRR